MLRLVCKAQEQPRERVREMAEELCISPRTAELLLSRGIVLAIAVACGIMAVQGNCGLRRGREFP